MKRDQQAYVDEEVLLSLPEGCLFYPGFGTDWEHPFRLFREHVSEFWFADVRMIRRPERLRQPRPLLDDSFGLSLFYQSIEDLGQQEVDDPNDHSGSLHHLHCMEKYSEPSGRVITVHRWNGFGQNALERIKDKVSVFFVRRCGAGEGNSAIWFNQPLATRLLGSVAQGGLIVTDGVSRDENEYQSFRSERDVDWREAIQANQPFSDFAGNRFECVGYAGDGYGPTSAWQINKPD